MQQLTSQVVFVRFVALLLLLLSWSRGTGQAAGSLVDSGLTVKGESDWIYYDLGCTDRSWDGYFSPSHWERRVGEERSPTAGAGSPAHREDCLHFTAARPRAERWSIDAPARGFLSFNLVADTATLAGVRLFINGVDQFLAIRAGSKFISPFLSEGDEFTLLLPAGEQPLRWEQLRFHTNASGVFFYPAERMDRYRYRPVSGSRIDRVLFPVSRYGGWPVFDYDGDINTLHDQQPLRQDTERFTVRYEDRVQLRAGGYVLLRTFNIRENCEAGNSLHRDVPWLPLPLLPEE